MFIDEAHMISGAGASGSGRNSNDSSKYVKARS